MQQMDTGPKFDPGRVVITQGAKSTILPEDVEAALGRHLRGDWGDLDAHDRSVNDVGLKDGDRLVSRYEGRSGVSFYVITEWDRSYTTILLPEEY